MTLVRRIGALAAVVVLAGCGTGEQPGTGTGEQRGTSWVEPARYTYVLDSRCGERLLIGKFRVTVADGAITNVEGLDESAKLAAESPAIKTEMPTLGQLVKRVADAKADGAHRATVEFDKVTGHPTRADIDREKNAIDDEECYTVTDYRS